MAVIKCADSLKCVTRRIWTLLSSETTDSSCVLKYLDGVLSVISCVLSVVCCLLLCVHLMNGRNHWPSQSWGLIMAESAWLDHDKCLAEGFQISASWSWVRVRGCIWCGLRELSTQTSCVQLQLSVKGCELSIPQNCFLAVFVYLYNFLRYELSIFNLKNFFKSVTSLVHAAFINYHMELTLLFLLKRKRSRNQF